MSDNDEYRVECPGCGVVWAEASDLELLMLGAASEIPPNCPRCDVGLVLIGPDLDRDWMEG